MSSHLATGWVLQHSEARGGERLVLLALADHCGNEDWKCYPSVERIARFARLSERGTQYALRALEAAGRILKVGVSSKGTNVWQIRTDSLEDFAGVQNLRGCNPAQEGVQSDAGNVSQIAPELEENQKELGGSGTGALARLDEIDPSQGSRQFRSAWPMEEAEIRHLISGEDAAVQEQAVDWLLSQYRNWHTNGMLWSLKGKVLPAIRSSVKAEQAPPSNRPLFGSRPITAGQQRASWGAAYAAEAARLRAEDEVIEAEVIEG